MRRRGLDHPGPLPGIVFVVGGFAHRRAARQPGAAGGARRFEAGRAVGVDRQPRRCARGKQFAGPAVLEQGPGPQPRGQRRIGLELVRQLARHLPGCLGRWAAQGVGAARQAGQGHQPTHPGFERPALGRETRHRRARTQRGRSQGVQRPLHARQQLRQCRVGSMGFKQQVEVMHQRCGAGARARSAAPVRAHGLLQGHRAKPRQRLCRIGQAGLGRQPEAGAVGGRYRALHAGAVLSLQGFGEPGGAGRCLGRAQAAGATEHGHDQQIKALRNVGQRERGRCRRWRGVRAVPTPHALHEVCRLQRRIGDDVLGFGHARRPAFAPCQTKVASTRSRIAPTSDSSSDKGETMAL